jgi:xanthine dehydrogenase accessory factor
MLVRHDRTTVGTLGGGCVEAEVKRQALAIIQGGEAELATFMLDDDYGWDDGLICGGRMQVLIEPLGAASQSDYFTRLAQLAQEGAGATEAIVFDAQASGLPAPSAYLFDAEDSLVASLRAELDHDDAPGQIRQHLKSLAGRPRSYTAEGVAYLTMLPRCRLVIVGGGHVGKSVAALAAELDFDVWVVDDREDIVSEQRFPTAQRRLAGAVDKVLPELEITPSTYCLIVTRGHNHDEEALYHLADRGAAYVGMIGSRRKIRLIFDDLLNEGISRDALDRVHAPVGLDIGSQTVPEIAVSICAELVSHRNRDNLRETSRIEPDLQAES